MNNSQFPSHRNIPLPTLLREARNINPILKEQAMCRATVVEHPQLLSLFHMLPFLNSDIARRDLRHSDTNERNRSDCGVISFDEDDGAGGHGRKVGLCGDDTHVVDVGVVVARVHCACEQGLGVVCAVDDVGPDDLPGDRRVPAVVAQSAQESLVDCPPNETVSHGVAAQHVNDGIGLFFDPEGVVAFHVVLDVVGLGLAGVDDDAVIVWRGDGTDAVVEEAGEEVVPGGVAVGLVGGVGDEHLIEGVVCFPDIGDSREVLEGCGTEPVELFGSQDVGGVGGLQERTPIVEDLLDHLVDFGVNERCESTRCTHWPVEDGVDGESDETHAVLSLAVGWCGADEVVQHAQHVLVVADLGSTVILLGVVERDFVEHGLEEHGEAGGGVDAVFEFFDDGVEFFGGFVDSSGYVG